jgi:hypothetical protein
LSFHLLGPSSAPGKVRSRQRSNPLALVASALIANAFGAPIGPHHRGAGIVWREAGVGSLIEMDPGSPEHAPCLLSGGKSVSSDHNETAPEDKPQRLRWIRGQVASLLRFLRLRSADRAQPLVLRPLTPTPIPEQHALYSDELVALLRNRRRRRNVWNIALSGGYGSGKSSILAAVRTRLDRRVVEISLSSLSDIGVQPEASEEEINNHIQKEIVKQLLYRERPSRVPGSRFRRISRLPFWRTVSISVLAGIIVAGAFWLTGWGAPLQLPLARESERVWLLGGIGLAVVVLAFVLQLLLHNRVRIDKLGTASTSVTLKTDGPGGEDSFFDKYLDEVVYFFEMTRRDIVIIEDLDRFENPAIYASLRALNTVLNTSRQLRRRPVHFIYAVRDSIFEDLTRPKQPDGNHDDLKEPGEHLPSRSDKPGVWQANPALATPATQRTKFFDLVVPIVPFITYRTSRDLLVREMERIDTSVLTDVLSVVAKHITDMRLLLNIVNEYRVFHARILAPNKLRGLTPNRLFAMIAYKNTRLEDFELIRVGNSSLDRLYREARELIDTGLAEVANEIAALEERSGPIAETQARAAQLGAELQAMAERWLPRLNKSKQNIQFRTDEQFRTTAEIGTPEFWAEVIDQPTDIEVWEGPNADAFHIDAAGLRAELGAIVPRRWGAEDDAEWRKKLQAAREQQRWLRSADFHQLTEPKRPLHRNEQEVNFRTDYLDPLDDPLLIELIAEGYIDRNFHLYVSEFHGEVTSANAMNFLIQHVQAEYPSYRYELKHDDALDEVTAVLREGGPEVFGSVGLFNVAIYDRLLGTTDNRLDRNIKLLAWTRPAGIEFIDLYAAEGQHKEQLFRRLAPHWPAVFTSIADRSGSTPDEQAALTLAAFEGADPSEEYSAPDTVRDEIAAQYKRLSELTDMDSDPARAIKMLQRLGVRLPALEKLSPAATTGVVTARQYVVTNQSLRIALVDAEGIGLDTIFRASDVVFDHVIAHFDEYLSALDNSTPPLQSLQDTSVLVDIMSAVERAEPGRSIEVLTRLPEALRIEDLNDVPGNVMGVLAEGQRFAITLHNINTYVSARSLDEPLARFLESERRVDAEAAEPAEQEALAAQLVNEKQLTVEARVQLAKSITQTLIPIAKISAREPELIQSLVEEGLIADDPNTFAALNKSGDCQVAFILGSQDVATYFDQLTPSAALLEQLLRNDVIDADIKNQIATLLPQTPQNATKEVVEALADWTSSTSTVLSPETVQVVQSSPASTPARAAILNLSTPALTPNDVLTYVQHLPEPYARLLERSTKPVDLPGTPNMDMVLGVIRADGSGPVSKWESVGEITRVWMRHPPKEDQ